MQCVQTVDSHCVLIPSLTRLLLLAIPLLAFTSCGSPAGNLPVDVAQTKQASTFPKLSIDEIAISFEIIKQDATGLPETIRVRFTNTSDKKGALELPGPVLGTPYGAYNTPAIAIFTLSGKALERDLPNIGTPEWMKTQNDDADGHGLLLLRSPSKSKWPKHATVSILASKQSMSVDYDTEEFCMTGHGIEPHANTNFRTCYQSGPVKTGLQVWLFLGNMETFERRVSNVIVASLTNPDTSMYREQDEVATPCDE